MLTWRNHNHAVAFTYHFEVAEKEKSKSQSVKCIFLDAYEMGRFVAKKEGFLVGISAGAALAAGADLYITGEARYHDLFNYDGKMLMAVIGHYESEQFTMDILKEHVNAAFPGLKVLKTAVNTNPVNYL
mgnify:CR=1 FL=1